MNEHVTVNFPKEMKVDAPKTDETIDALKASFEKLFEQLHNNIKVLVKQIGQLQEDIPLAIQGLEELISYQFRLSFLKQFEAYIINHKAQILTDEKRIIALRNFLEKKQKQFEKEHKSIQERYVKLLSQVSKNNMDRRRKLDSHAYSLLERVFPEQIQERFSNISLPSYNYLSAHATESAIVRTSSILEAFKEAQRAIEHFVHLRDEAYEKIDDLISRDIEPGWYSFPVRFAEVENRDNGERRIEYAIPKVFEELPQKVQKMIRKYAEIKLTELNSEPLTNEAKKVIGKHLKETGDIIDSEIIRFSNDVIELQNTV